jgi:hypothetical protein
MGLAAIKPSLWALWKRHFPSVNINRYGNQMHPKV